MFYIGSTYIIGNITPYIAEVYGVTTVEASDIGLITLFLIALLSPIGTYLVQRGAEPKLVILIGGALGLSMMHIAARQTSYLAFKWLYAFSFALNNGLTFYASVHQAWLFFPDHPGLATGLIFSGLGGAGFVFDNLSTKLINPDNIPISSPDFSSVVNERFTLMFNWLIFCWAFIVLATAILVWKAPEPRARISDEEQQLINTEANGVQSDGSVSSTSIKIEEEFDPSSHASLPEMLISNQCVLLYILALLANFTNSFING